MAKAQVGVEITAEDKATGVIQGVRNSLNSLKTSVKDLEPAFKSLATVGGAAFGSITAIATKGLYDYMGAAREMKIANLTLTNTLDTLSNRELKNLAKQMGNSKDVLGSLKGAMDAVGKSAVQLGMDDEEASKAFAKLFSVTKNVTQSQKEIKLAMDLAAFSGRTLEDATQALVNVHAGKATVLREFGFSIKDVATEEEALALVSSRVKGSAEELASPLKIIKIEMQNISEAIGASLKPHFDKLMAVIKPMIDRFVEWAEANPKLIVTILAAGAAVSGLLLVVGTLGLALPAIITGFSMLLTPVGAITVAIAALIGVFILLYGHWKEILGWLEQKTGLVSFFQLAWEMVSNTVSMYLMPALRDLWAHLQPYQPFFEMFIKVLGVGFVGSLYLAIGTITGVITALSLLLTVATKVVTFLADGFLGIIKMIVDWISTLINKVNDLINALSKLNIAQAAKNVAGAVGGAIGNAANWIGNKLGVQDAIIAPNGNIITTAPDDYLIATKNPRGLGGGIVVNINGGTYLSEDAAAKIGDLIIDRLRLQFKGV